jgi:hypothetical protein
VRFPHRSHLALGPFPGAVPCARLHTKLVLAEWGLAALAEAAELVVSELVTNAITATRAAGAVLPVRLWLASEGSRALILVGDASPGLPRRIDPADGAEGGRGLLLVEALSGRWGWYGTNQREPTKIVWSELRPETRATAAAGPVQDGPHDSGQP